MAELQLELATTDQICQELRKRNLDFVFVCLPQDSPQIENCFVCYSDLKKTIAMLERAWEFLNEEE